MSLCYEVQGRVNNTYNLLSDSCVSVNALYSSAMDPFAGSVISKIGVLAVDDSKQCQQIEVDLQGCAARVNGEVVEEYKQDGVSMTHHRGGNRVRIAVPNCKNATVVMWVNCQVKGMMPFDITHAAGLSRYTHGLVGKYTATKGTD